MKYDIQSANINFLFGSGLSYPFLATLGSIEQRLTELESATGVSPTVKKIVLASIRKTYFDLCIAGNCDILSKSTTSAAVLSEYENWLKSLNQILINRKNTLISKQVNLFTTNMDIFPEVALESLELEYNDGFYGSFFSKLGLSNFKKSVSKISQQYGVTSELPMFNVYKLHGSANWKMNTANNEITCDQNLSGIAKLKQLSASITGLINPIVSGGGLDTLANLFSAAASIRSTREADQFNTEYEKLVIVNPTKDKFKLTTLNQTYYELLRMYANELERENAVLFVMGFSFADEHIAEITLRAARSNPTLKIYIYAYNASGEAALRSNLKITSTAQHSNIHFVPRRPIVDAAGTKVDEVPFDLKNINSQEFETLARDTNGRK